MMVYFLKSDQISKKKMLKDSIIEKKLKSRMGVKAIGFGAPPLLKSLFQFILNAIVHQ